MWLATWAFFLPSPYDLVVCLLAVCPWVGVFVVGRASGLIRFDGGQHDGHPHLVTLFILASGMLSLRAAVDYEVVESIDGAMVAVAVASLLFAAMLAADPSLRKSKSSAVAMLLFSFLYGYGAAIEINALADSSDMTHHRYTLLEKHISKGNVWRRVAKLHKVQAESPDVYEAQVSPFFYEKLQPGDSVCLAVRPGALGIAWFSAGPCAPAVP